MEEHPIRLDDTNMLQHARQTMELVVKKAICIWTTPESSYLNHDGGYDLSNYRIATYGKLGGGARVGHTHPIAS